MIIKISFKKNQPALTPVPKTSSKSYSSFEVHLGALNFNDESETGRVIVTSDQATLHEYYDDIGHRHHSPAGVSVWA
jgi:hypothetical protein